VGIGRPCCVSGFCSECNFHSRRQVEPLQLRHNKVIFAIVLDVRQHIIFQRVEAVFLFIVSTYIYFDLGLSLIVYMLALFVFDISMIGYAKDAKWGAYLYNLGHSLILPLAVVLIAWITNNTVLAAIGLIWIAHIGLDRSLGYGLKLTTGFKKTHLGDIGKS
jgi:hypothetical protein